MVGFWGVEENLRPLATELSNICGMTAKYTKYFSDGSDDEDTFTSDEDEMEREMKKVLNQRMEEENRRDEILKIIEEKKVKRSRFRTRVRRYNPNKSWLDSSSETDTSSDDEIPFQNRGSTGWTGFGPRRGSSTGWTGFGLSLEEFADWTSFGPRRRSSTGWTGSALSPEEFAGWINFGPTPGSSTGLETRYDRLGNRLRSFQTSFMEFERPELSLYNRFLSNIDDYQSYDYMSSGSGPSFHSEGHELDDDSSISGVRSLLWVNGGNALRFAPIDVYPGFIRYETTHFDILSADEVMLARQSPYVYGYDSFSWFLCQNLMYRCPIPESVYMMTEEWAAYWMSLSTKYFGPGYLDGTLSRCSCMVQVGTYIYKEARACTCGAYAESTATDDY